MFLSKRCRVHCPSCIQNRVQQQEKEKRIREAIQTRPCSTCGKVFVDFDHLSSAQINHFLKGTARVKCQRCAGEKKTGNSHSKSRSLSTFGIDIGNTTKSGETVRHIRIYTNENPLLPVASNNGSDGLRPVEPLMVRGTISKVICPGYSTGTTVFSHGVSSTLGEKISVGLLHLNWFGVHVPWIVSSNSTSEPLCSAWSTTFERQGL